MAILLKLSYVRDGVAVGRTLTPSDATVTQAATQAGWQPKIPDPTANQQLKDQQVKVLTAATPEEQAAEETVLRNLSAALREPIPNPTTAEEFVVDTVLASLAELLVDRQAIQTASEEAARLKSEQELESRKAAALAALAVTEVDPATI